MTNKKETIKIKKKTFNKKQKEVLAKIKKKTLNKKQKEVLAKYKALYSYTFRAGEGNICDQFWIFGRCFRVEKNGNVIDI